jgi:CBS domain-containing protein
MKVSQCLVPTPLTLSKDESLEQLVYKVLDCNQTTAAVVDSNNKLLGMVGIHDIFKKILPSYIKMGTDMGINLGAAIHEGYFNEKFETLKTATVAEFMTEKVDYIVPEDTAIFAIAEMVKRKRKALPVKAENGDFVGMITRRSILVAVLPNDKDKS